MRTQALALALSVFGGGMITQNVLTAPPDGDSAPGKRDLQADQRKSQESLKRIGLAMHRRWAEYLTVFGTGLLIPYEMYEVIRHATLLKGGALVLNIAVVAYLAWKKRLFVDV